ncbi:MAG TPA: hypothetical protein QF924_20045 [Pseudomonadales bacterium]|jgi:hypothetical protein|nr:hypothetical protein [Pseudomonadales bacterium]
MPIRFRISKKRRLITVIVEGKITVEDTVAYIESAHKVVKKVKTPSRSQPTRKLGSSCTNLTI